MKKVKILILTLALSVSLSGIASSHDIDIEKLKQELKAEILRELRTPAALKAQIPVPAPAIQFPVETAVKKEGLWLGDKLKFSGQVRVRPEVRRNLTQTLPAVPGPAEENASFLLRTRLGLEFFPVDHVSFFIQGQDARDFGEEAPALPTAIGDDEGFDLHQGYLDLKKIGNKPFNIRIGRQEIKLGDERLVGAVNWSNVGRSFDGILFSYEPEKWGLKALAAVTDRTGVTNLGDGQYFGGLYATWKRFPGGVLDGYYFLLQDNNGAVGAAAGTRDTQSVHTVGFRAKGAYESGLDFTVEPAAQLGKFGSNSILAFAAHGKTGYTFKPDWKPRVGVEYNYATGDDPTSTRFTKFNNLFPTNHDKYGLMDMATWSNLHDGVFSLSINPKKVFVGLDYHLLMVDKNTSASDTFATLAGAPGLGKTAGHEIDLFAKWTMNPFFDILGGFSHFIPGSFLKGQGITTSSDFFYVQAQGQFN